MAVYYEEKETFTLACNDQLTDVILKRSGSAKAVTMEESAGSTRTIADTDGAVAIDLAGITEGQFLFLETDAELDVKINGAATGFLLKPVAPAKSSLKLVSGSFTSLTLTNLQAGTTANVKITAAGVG